MGCSAPDLSGSIVLSPSAPSPLLGCSVAGEPTAGLLRVRDGATSARTAGVDPASSARGPRQPLRPKAQPRPRLLSAGGPPLPRGPAPGPPRPASSLSHGPSPLRVSKRSECEDSYGYVGSSTSWIRSSSKRDLSCRYR